MQRLFLPFYLLLILFLTIYSYVLVDPNITFINNHLWTVARNILVNFGYYQRDISSIFFVFIIIFLFIFHYLAVKHYKKINLFAIIIALSFLTILSYPFLSHDFFNYLFDAKIVTFYHQNPYLMRALDFPNDPWIRFMHWTHRTYPYGPTFLLITLIPSFLSFGKFILDFIFFKITFFVFFTLAVYLLNKLNKKWAIIFATNPLVIMEGLINAHNDLIEVSLAIIGIYFLYKKKGGFWILGRLVLLVSSGIKYITLPLIFLVKDNRHWFFLNSLIFIGLLLILGYLSLKFEVQPWYFLALFALLPFYEKLILNLNIFFAGLLFSYYPYIRFGDWGRKGNVTIKHDIIIIFLVINIVVLFLRFVFFKKNK